MSAKIFYRPVSDYIEFESEHLNLKNIIIHKFGNKVTLDRNDINYLEGLGDAGCVEAYDLIHLINTHGALEIEIMD